MRPPPPPHAPPSTEATTSSGPPPRPTTHSPTPLPNFNTKPNLRLSASSAPVGGAASSLLRLDTVPSAFFLSCTSFCLILHSLNTLLPIRFRRDLLTSPSLTLRYSKKESNFK